MISHPLVVDLDGTLIKTDLLVESFFLLFGQNPLYIFVIPFWFLKGKAYLKEQIARRVMLDVSVLPYHSGFLTYLKMQRAGGRRLVLATASDERLARQVADYLRIFDLIFASDGTTNLSAESKRNRLVAEFGEKGFDYAGNDRRDLVVWSSARKAIVVNPGRRVRSAVARAAEVEQVFEDRKNGAMLYLQAMRLHHWLKNLLIFVPLLAAHRFHEVALLAQAFLAFLCFGLCASSVYLLNDLLDLPHDRHHPRKRQRPFAAGELSLYSGLALIPVLLVLSGLLSMFLPLVFLEILAIYYGLTLAYSFYLKRIVLLDVIVLAGLYTVRMMAGSSAVTIWPSSWLLALSTFLFLSLALAKRYTELVTMRDSAEGTLEARCYHVSDMELLASLGSASGYVAVLVLALYVTSGTAQVLYGRHEVIWLLCPLLLYWISYVWLIAHRGKMYDDPIVFALKDRVSRIIILLMAVTAIVAA